MRLEAGRIVSGLFRQHRIAWSVFGQPRQQQRVGLLITAPAQVLRRVSGVCRPDLEQQLACLFCQSCSQPGVGDHASIRESTQSAMAEGPPCPGRSTRSGFSGAS